MFKNCNLDDQKIYSITIIAAIILKRVMNSILNEIIKDYYLKQDGEINIAKEIIQNICLSALSRTDFFVLFFRIQLVVINL